MKMTNIRSRIKIKNHLKNKPQLFFYFYDQLNNGIIQIFIKSEINVIKIRKKNKTLQKDIKKSNIFFKLYDNI